MLSRPLGLALAILAAGVWPVEATVLTLSWVDNANNDDGYAIERAQSWPPGPYHRIALVPANTTAYQDGTLVDGRVYCYRVQAFNAIGGSGYSPPDCGVAGQPETVVAPRVAVQVNHTEFRAGDTLVLTASLTPGLPALVDLYVVARLPDGSVLSLQPDGSLAPGLAPVATGVPLGPALSSGPLHGVILQYTFTGAEPPGLYAWLAGLTWAGTVELVGPLPGEVAFHIVP